MAKSERSGSLKAIAKIIKDDTNISQYENFDITKHIEFVKKEIVRNQILNDRVRADKRALDEVRPISIETNILPNAHGSAIFTRGQTQALVVTTLGTDVDKQPYSLITEGSSKYENFMLHYNFPGFSVGEASRIGAPGRRELGHGNLAKRALESMIYSDGAIRVVSEILESNGSSSMATVCGATLALKAAGVGVKKLVAGVAMGLVMSENRYAILTDIMGLEDHDGDMDFKVAGTKDGVTAMQMDIKLGGISYEILREALYQAKVARVHILSLMEVASQDIVVNRDILPSSKSFLVRPDKIVDIIGQAGKTIREIIEKFDVIIDLDREAGNVKVTGRNRDNVDNAINYINEIVSKEPIKKRVTVNYNVGEEMNAKVKKLADFGAFVELPNGTEALVHISKLSKTRVEKVSDVVKEGDEVVVKFLGMFKGKIELSLEKVI
jgi:polyribonucleotide nucleotidyltransferase